MLQSEKAQQKRLKVREQILHSLLAFYEHCSAGKYIQALKA